MPCCIIYFKWILTWTWRPFCPWVHSSGDEDYTPARLQQISSSDASVLTHMLIQIKFVRYYSEQTSLILIPAVRNCPVSSCFSGLSYCWRYCWKWCLLKWNRKTNCVCGWQARRRSLNGLAPPVDEDDLFSPFLSDFDKPETAAVRASLVWL